jgi:hypothetical protein
MNDRERWYRQFWPWFIIALPATAVAASLWTIWLALSHPDPLIERTDDPPAASQPKRGNG